MGGAGDCLEQLTTLAFIAGQTATAKLLTSVMVLPYRSPVNAAKVLATIDILSGGRLIVGCGVGWMREEFYALGAPSFVERGRVSDEYIGAFKELWTNDSPEFQGEYAVFLKSLSSRNRPRSRIRPCG
jgi:alkanesulfonate monooxygenase SsuD/methylene tetrahydromethanopterin reductase-like flavin-dependent oxidoreductase (luciferase family)